jgi:chromosome segregation ATPase
MRERLRVAVALVCVAGTGAWAQEVFAQAGPRSIHYTSGYGQPPDELTIEEQRQLGLTEDQMRRIAEKRREIEKTRAKLQEQLDAAQEAVRTANAEVARLRQEIHTGLADQLREACEAVMTDAQRKEWRRQRFVEQGKQWLRGYTNWLKLTDAQVEDISALLVPVFEKYARMESQLDEAREQLAKARQATPIDLDAIDAAEKRVDELSKRNLMQLRQNDLMDAMRAGLMPDQLEKFDKIHRRR